MKTKKLLNQEFGFNPDAFNGRGYWYIIGKNGGMGRPASRKESQQLGHVLKSEIEPTSPKVYDEQDSKLKVKKEKVDYGPSREGVSGYATARKVGKTKLGDLIADRVLRGQGGFKALGGAISDKFKAKTTRIKEKFDPLNIARMLTGSGGAAILGSALGRKKEDIEYFTGRRAEKGKRKKKGSAEPMVTTIGGARITPIQKEDTVADVAAKLYGLFKNHFEQLKLQSELDKNHLEEVEAQRKRRHEELLKAIRGKGEKRGKQTTAMKQAEEGKSFVDQLMDAFGMGSNMLTILRSIGPLLLNPVTLGILGLVAVGGLLFFAATFAGRPRSTDLHIYRSTYLQIYRRGGTVPTPQPVDTL